MRLVSYSLKNFKSVKEECRLDGLATINALIGPNNQGKSTFLQALYLLRTIRSTLPDGPEEYFQERHPSKDETNVFEVKLEFALDSSDRAMITASGDPDPGIDRFIFGIRWGGQQEGVTPRFIFPFSVTARLENGTYLPLFMTQSSTNPKFQIKRTPISKVPDTDPRADFGSLEFLDVQPLINEDFTTFSNTESLLAFLGDWCQRLVLVPSQRDIVPIGSANANPTNPTRENLPALIHTMRSNEEGKFEEFQNIVAQLIPSVSTVTTHIEANRQDISIRVFDGPVERSVDAYRLDTVGQGVIELLYIAASI